VLVVLTPEPEEPLGATSGKPRPRPETRKRKLGRSGRSAPGVLVA
jgi:hypothetical protein